MKYGFIGCGNMGGALATALSKTTRDILLADADETKALALADKLDVKSGTVDEVASSCERIFFGVKPQVMRPMIDGIAHSLKLNKPTVISMAAGISTDSIESMIGEKLPIIRIMPNTPVSVGKGVVLVCSNALVTDDVLDSFIADMGESGTVDTIPERLIDAGCSLSGCGPAFMYMMIEALADGAVACGLPRDKALKYAAATMSGAAETVLESGKHPGELKDAVCSPGGSTIVGVRALEEGGLRAAAMSAVIEAYKKNIELGK